MRKMLGFLLVWGLTWTTFLSAMDTKVEVAEVVWEEIPTEEPSVQIEQGEVFARTHEVDVNEFILEDAGLLMRIGQAEAGNQGPDGMWLVMSVVLNRVQDPNFPSTVREVIYDPHQFSSVSNGSFDRVRISADAHEALARIERGDVAPMIIGFETIKSKELDKYFCEAFTFRDHKFYTLQ